MIKQTKDNNIREALGMGRLSGKVALITGAGSGIGQATALLFAKEGAKVILADIATEGGEKAAEMIKDADGEAAFVKADVSQEDDVKALVNKVIETYGRLDCAHNNAGIDDQPAPTADCSMENFDRTIAVNLRGVFLCMKYEIAQMLKQGSGGGIVNTSSIAGLVATPNVPAYNASKHGVIGLTKTAAVEYAEVGIRINAVCPAFTRTPIYERVIDAMPEMKDKMAEKHPLGRIAEPEEVANAVLWLCSDEASFVTSHPLVIDGGYINRL